MLISLIEANRELWNDHWPSVRHATLLQSWEYGKAKCRSRFVRPLRYLIRNENMEPVGLLQVVVLSLPLIGGIARINRGPVFFTDMQTGLPSQENRQSILNALRDLAKRNRWLLLRMVPEFFAGNDSVAAMLEEHGFRKMGTSPVASALIDIFRNTEEIRAGLDGKWRNLLNKSEKMGLELESPSLDAALPFFVMRYEAMQREKDFKGIPTELIKSMALQEGPLWECRILYAKYQGERHGAIMTVGHGDTCTYLIGWTSKEGRRLQANYFLIWQAILLLRERGYRYFDVGGLGSQTTTGVEHFKKGLKGREYSLIGEFYYSPLLR